MSVAYSIIPNYGVALILITIFIRLILFPTQISQQKGLAKNARMQAKMQRLQKKYGSNKKRLQEEQQNLYQREGFNPLSGGCLGQFIQLPILLALYNVVYRPLTYIAYAPSTVIDAAKDALLKLNLEGVTQNVINLQGEVLAFKHYDQIKSAVPELTQYYEKLGSGFFNFLGLDLSATPHWNELNVILLIPILSGLSSLVVSLVMMKRQKKQSPESAKSMGCLTYGMPIFSLWIAFSVPAAIGLYWIASNIATLIVNIITNKLYPPEEMLGKIFITETIERRSKENMRKDRLLGKTTE